VFNIYFNIKCCPNQEVFIYNNPKTIRWLSLLWFYGFNSTMPYTLTWILIIQIKISFLFSFFGLNHFIAPIGLMLVYAIFVWDPCVHAMCPIYGFKLIGLLNFIHFGPWTLISNSIHYHFYLKLWSKYETLNTFATIHMILRWQQILRMGDYTH
jgi:hypothetical protein